MTFTTKQQVLNKIEELKKLAEALPEEKKWEPSVCGYGVKPQIVVYQGGCKSSGDLIWSESKSNFQSATYAANFSNKMANDLLVAKFKEDWIRLNGVCVLEGTCSRVLLYNPKRKKFTAIDKSQWWPRSCFKLVSYVLLPPACATELADMLNEGKIELYTKLEGFY